MNHKKKYLKLVSIFVILLILGIISKNYIIKIFITDYTSNKDFAVNFSTFKDDDEFIHYLEKFKLKDKNQKEYNSRKLKSLESTDNFTVDLYKNNFNYNDSTEGDSSKTDGCYIYTIKNESATKALGKVLIIDAQDPKKLNIISEIPIDGYLNELYITETKLVVISNEKRGLDGKVEVLIYNKTNLTNPGLERKITYNSFYVKSNFSNNRLTLITNKALYSLLDKNNITKKDVENNLPQYYDSYTNTDTTIGTDKINFCEQAIRDTLTTVSSINIENTTEPISSQTILANREEIYCSQENTFFSLATYFSDNIALTGIINFANKDGVIKPISTGYVPGIFLNQFSMDYYNDTFKIATAQNFGEVHSNNIYVLNSDLKVIGSLKGLAPNEAIHSVKFINDKAYLVNTIAKQPLYSIDLKYENDIKLIESAIVPDFKNVLLKTSDNILLGFGDERNDYGKINNNLKFSVYNLNENYKPVENFVDYLGNEEAYSETFLNHNAFYFDKNSGLISIPYKEHNNIQLRNNIYFARLNKNNTIEKIGSMDIGNSDYKDRLRTLQIDNNIYVINNKEILRLNINNLDILSRLELK